MSIELIEQVKGAVFSKTVWFNGIVGVLGAITWIQDNALLVSAITPAVAPYMTAIGAIGVLLRFFTSKSLSDKAV